MKKIFSYPECKIVNEVFGGRTAKIDIQAWSKLYVSSLKRLGIDYKKELSKSIVLKAFKPKKSAIHLSAIRDELDDWSYAQVVTHAREISIEGIIFDSYPLDIGDVMVYKEIKFPLNIKPQPSFIFNSIVSNDTLIDKSINTIRIGSGLCNTKTLSLVSLENLINFRLNLTKLHVAMKDIYVPFQTNNKKLILDLKTINSEYREIIQDIEVFSKDYCGEVNETMDVLKFIRISNNLLFTSSLEYTMENKGSMISSEYLLELKWDIFG